MLAVLLLAGALFLDASQLGIVLALIIVGSITIRRYRFKYTINVDTVESREGIIARNTVQIFCSDVRALVVKQNGFGRLFNYGDLEISSAADAGIKVAFKGVHRPYNIRDIVLRLRRESDGGIE